MQIQGCTVGLSVECINHFVMIILKNYTFFAILFLLCFENIYYNFMTCY